MVTHGRVKEIEGLEESIKELRDELESTYPKLAERDELEAEVPQLR